MSPLLMLGQTAKITVWFTPIWLISVGLGIGFLLVVLMLAKFWITSKLPFFNTVAEKPGLRMVMGGILGAVYIGLFLLFYHWRYGITALDESLVLPLLFVVPFSFLLGWGCWDLVSRQKSVELFSLVREGFLGWLNVVGIVVVFFAVSGIVLEMTNGFGIVKFAEQPFDMLQSAMRLPASGEFSNEFVVPPNPDRNEGVAFEVPYHGEEVAWVEIQSNQPIEMASEPLTVDVPPFRIFEITASQEAERKMGRDDGQGPIPHRQLEEIYISNLGKSDATVKTRWKIEPYYSEVWVLPWSAFCVVLVYLSCLLMAVVSPKVSAISLSTFKTEVSQPLYLLVFIIGVVFVVGSIYIPYNTFGEDIKMYKDSGLTMLKVLAIFMAIWAASKSVAEEIEGRTALTVLSKPVGRRQFILGKFSGISLAVALFFVVIGIWFIVWTGYKPIYDGVESSKGAPEWQQCFNEAVRLVPALFLAFLEVVIFVAISVAISTRFGILANFLICFTIYVLGHLTPLIVQSADVVQAFAPVVLFGQVVSILFPVLDHFDVQAAINTNRDVPLAYLGWSMIYCFLYGTMAMLLGLVLFEDRDLA